MYVFISYSRKDRRFVDRLVARLEDEGIDVWRDVDALAGGEAWRASIADAIRECDAVIAVVTPDLAASANVAKELSVAEDRGKLIVPLVRRPTRLSGSVELHLTSLQQVDFTGDFEVGLRALLAALQHGIPRSGGGSTQNPQRRWHRPAAAVAAAAFLVAGVMLVMVVRPSRDRAGTAASTSAPTSACAQKEGAPKAVLVLNNTQLTVSLFGIGTDCRESEIRSLSPGYLGDVSVPAGMKLGFRGPTGSTWKELYIVGPKDRQFLRTSPNCSPFMTERGADYDRAVTVTPSFPLTRTKNAVNVFTYDYRCQQVELALAQPGLVALPALPVWTQVNIVSTGIDGFTCTGYVTPEATVEWSESGLCASGS